jgi:hypothetical protein
VPEPVLGSAEFYGTVRCADDPGPVTCFGAALDEGRALEPVPLLPAKAHDHLADVVRGSRHTGGLLLWPKWEKFSFTSLTVTRHLAGLV